MIITVDGPAASGKGTLARRLAAHFGFAHLDTGLLYRAVGKAVLDAGADPDDRAAAVSAARSLTAEALDDPALRGDAVAAAASKVAAVAAVRTALLRFQRGFARHPPGGAPGAVLDGRDIGTVVCPTADVKFYVTASLEARARRRHRELLEVDPGSIYDRVLQDLAERDARDSRRASAPMQPAPDANRLDTTNLDAEAAFAVALAVVGDKVGEVPVSAT